MAKKIKIPKVTELWMLWDIGIEDWIVAMDGPRIYNAYLCATSKEAAEVLQEQQKRLCEIESVIVRVK